MGDKMVSASDVRILVELQEKENDGQGINCAEMIINELLNHNVDEAKAIWTKDGDELKCYPKVREFVESILGCQLHNSKHCIEPQCEKSMDMDFLKHELMDRTFMVSEMVGNFLLDHIEDNEEVYIADSELRKEITDKIKVAHKALFDAYQMTAGI